MTRIFTLFLFCLSLFSCQMEEDKPNCDQESGQAMDIVSGPATFLSSWGGDRWGFLCDESGNAGVADWFSSYTVFINYLFGCRSAYTVNVVQSVLYNEEEPDSSAAIMTSYVNIPYGQAVELYDPISRPNFPPYPRINRTIQVTNLPETVAEWELIPDLTTVFETSVHIPSNLFQIELTEGTGRLGFFYLVIRPEGEDQRYAVLVDLSNGPDQYDFSEAARPVNSHTVDVPDCSAILGFAEVLDAERGDIVFLKSDTSTNGTVKLWTVNPDAQHLLFMNLSNTEKEQHYHSQLFDEIPASVECPDKPVDQLYWTEQYLSVDMIEEGALRIEMDKVGQLFFDHYREMRGLLSPGRYRFNHPLLPQNLKDTFPGLELPTTLYEEGHTLNFLQFERLPDLSAYPKIESWAPAIDRYVYHQYRLNVE